MNNNYLPGIQNFRGPVTLGRQGSLSVQQVESSHIVTSLQADNVFQQTCSLQSTSCRTGSAAGISVLTTSGVIVCQPNMLDLAAANSAMSTCQPGDVPHLKPPDLIATCSCGNLFTFTTPTQSCIYSPTLTVTTQNRMQYSRPQTFAPTGCSAQWQHSFPQKLPWVQQNRMVNQQTVNAFAGKFVHI